MADTLLIKRTPWAGCQFLVFSMPQIICGLSVNTRGLYTCLGWWLPTRSSVKEREKESEGKRGRERELCGCRNNFGWNNFLCYYWDGLHLPDTRVERNKDFSSSHLFPLPSRVGEPTEFQILSISLSSFMPFQALRGKCHFIKTRSQIKTHTTVQTQY